MTRIGLFLRDVLLTHDQQHQTKCVTSDSMRIFIGVVIVTIIDEKYFKWN